jgi:hypothetical protein
MFFLVDNKNKVIFGWSPKCGCSRAKKIFGFLQNNTIINDGHTHTGNDSQPLPNDIENYITIIFSRNPYKKIISGFLDKYRKNGEFRHLWKHNKITFYTFVDELIKNDRNMIEPHHFEPQTGGHYNTNILRSKCLKIYDIEHIDYSFIENLYHKKIPYELLKFDLMGHERKKFNNTFEGPVYDLDMDEYYDYNVDIKYFYDEEIKNKVYNFYRNDFLFFNHHGIYY